MFHYLLTQFKCCTLHITLQLQGDCNLPAYKGSMWHGWLGHAVKQVSEPAFRALYQQHDHEQPKPYAIDPGRDQKTQWQQGELLDFSLRLFGSAAELLPVIYQALQAGEMLGLGMGRTPVKVIAVVGDAGTSQGYSQSLSDVLNATRTPLLAGGGLQLLLDTPLRLKQRGAIIRDPVQLNASLLALQSRRRLLQLTKYWVTDDDAVLQSIAEQSLGADHCAITAAVYFEDWQRFSLKQQEFIPFGGFKGMILLQSVSTELRNWLKIGEQLQLGGKTTFGLGTYRLIEP